MRNKIKTAIIKYLKDTQNHLTSEDLFLKIKNNLGEIEEKIYLEELDYLEKNQEVVSFVTTRKKYYDIKVSTHYHFICEKCGKVKEIFINEGAVQMLADHVQKLISSYAVIGRINLSFQGLCHNCRKA